MINHYVAWGNPNLNLNLSDNQFVFINGFGEFVGTAIFIFLLITTLCNFNLKHSQNYTDKKGGLITFSICLSLFFAYMLSIGVSLGIMTAISNDKPIDIVNSNPLLFNPGFSIAYMIKGFNYEHASFYIPVGNGFVYILFEFLGGFVGAYGAYFFYKPLIIKERDDFNLVASCFYTSSKHKGVVYNFMHETINTTIFMILILAVVVGFSSYHEVGINVLKQALVCASLFVILIALGGVIGNALNPVRDLCPRLILGLFYDKQHKKAYLSDWRYAWIPAIAPIIGCILGVIIMPGFLY